MSSFNPDAPGSSGPTGPTGPSVDSQNDQKPDGFPLNWRSAVEAAKKELATEMSSRFQTLSQQTRNLYKKLDESKDATNRLQIDNKYVKEQVDQLTTKVIEVLGIFVAFFTFISVSFNLFSKENVMGVTLIGFQLILLGGLLLFIVVLDTFIRQPTQVQDFHSWTTQDWIKFSLIFLAIISLLAGTILVGVSKEFVIHCDKVSSECRVQLD